MAAVRYFLPPEIGVDMVPQFARNIVEKFNDPAGSVSGLVISYDGFGCLPLVLRGVKFGRHGEGSLYAMVV
jgi:hypothetical protein